MSAEQEQLHGMADLFHDDINPRAIAMIWWEMFECQQHRFMILTKRPENMLKWLQAQGKYSLAYPGRMSWPLPNVALGVTCENQALADERLHYLAQCQAAGKFVSIEPMLGPVNLMDAWPDWWECNGIDLVICGGESGPGARPMDPDWARSLRDQCRSVGIPFHFKQWGGVNKKAAGRLLDGVTHDGAINWRPL